MPVVAAALRGGQGSGSAVRLGNDNIEHARPPRTVCGSTSTRVSAAAFTAVRGYAPRRWLTSSLVRPECIILLRRVILQNFREYPHGAVAKKKNRRAAERVATLRERNGRVYWMPDVQPRRGTDGVLDGAPPLSVGAAAAAPPIGRRRPTWRQRGQPAPPQPLFTRFPLDRYFCGSRTTTTTATAMCTLCATAWERRDSRPRSENKRDTEARTRPRAPSRRDRHRPCRRRIPRGYQAHTSSQISARGVKIGACC